MTSHNSDLAFAEARAVVLAWVQRVQPGEDVTNEELAQSFCSLLPADVDLKLRTTYNPSALVYEARWYNGDREVEEFPKPFCAETDGDARILACAAMVNLPD